LSGDKHQLREVIVTSIEEYLTELETGGWTVSALDDQRTVTKAEIRVSGEVTGCCWDLEVFFRRSAVTTDDDGLVNITRTGGQDAEGAYLDPFSSSSGTLEAVVAFDYAKSYLERSKAN
jgi:hypothetical protein